MHNKSPHCSKESENRENKIDGKVKRKKNVDRKSQQVKRQGNFIKDTKINKTIALSNVKKLH